MRKILLASTALVAVAGVSAATAEVSLSGNTAFGYHSWSDDVTDAATAGDNNNEFVNDTDLAASWSTTTDSGLSVSVSYDIDADESSATISGDWGNLSWDDGAEAQEVGQGDADPITVFNTGTHTASYDGAEGINGGQIAYTNAISGIEFGLGLSNGGSTSLADETSWGVAYSAEVAGGATVTLGYAGAKTGYDNSSAEGLDSTNTSLNGSVAIGDLTLYVASNTSKVTRHDDNATGTNFTDYKSNNFGISYAVSDSLSLHAHSRAATGTETASNAAATDYKYDLTVYGVDYTIASGVALTASYSDYTESGGGVTTDDISGTATTVRLKVSF